MPQKPLTSQKKEREMDFVERDVVACKTKLYLWEVSNVSQCLTRNPRMAYIAHEKLYLRFPKDRRMTAKAPPT